MNLLIRHRKLRPVPKQILRIVKLTVIIITALFIQVSAASKAQISIAVSNTPLSSVLSTLKKQSGYDFFYNDADIKNARLLTVKLNNVTLEEALTKCLRRQDLTYTIEDKIVVIKKKESSLMAQVADVFTAIDIRGSVLDKDGIGLPNTSVRIKGSKMATVTNAEGVFEFKNISEHAILVISYIGYQTLEIKASDDLSAIKLAIDMAKLEEVTIVSTGYRNIKQANLTGAAAVVDRKTYDQRVAVTGNFLESLEGKIPGLVYNSTTGELSIRGVSTFDAVKQPLIVLDGFPTEVDIRSINPNDITSVTVLKDAAAASIYGARASNGVIVIETKRGKSGKPVFSFRSTLAYQGKQDFGDLNLGSALEYAQLEKDYVIASGQNRTTYTNAKVPYSPVQAAVFDFKEGKISASILNQKISEIGGYDNLNAYKSLFYQRRLARQLDFDVSGGSEKNTYLIGANYVAEDHQYARTNDEKVLLNFASTHQFTPGIKFDFRGTYTNLYAKNPGNQISFNSFYPYEKLAGTSGEALPVSVGPNRNPYTGVTVANNESNIGIGLYDNLYYPYAELDANRTESRSSALRFQGRLTAKLSNWLNLELGGVYEDETVIQDRLQTEAAFAVKRLLNYKATKDATTGAPIFGDLPKGDFLGRVNARTRDYTARGQLNFNYKTPDGMHLISGIAGSEVRKLTQSSYLNTFFGYDGQSLIVKPVNFIKLANAGLPAFATLPSLNRAAFIYENYFSEGYNDTRFISFYGEGTYTYQDKYALTGSLRLDKTNLFGADPKYRNKPFYSVGALWRLNNEDFLASLDWMTNLKIRTAYGVNGNVPSSNNGPFLILNSGLNYYISPIEQYYDVLSPSNQSLRWEQTKNYNLGLDYALFNNRIYGTVDYYRKSSIDVFGQYSSDPTSGFNEYNANTASILNKGLEFSINSFNIQTSTFSWQTQITASFNTNKVTQVKTASNSDTGLPLVSVLNIQKGYPIDALFAYNYAGLNALGQPQIYGADGNKKMISTAVAQSDEVSLEDLKYMGTTTPKQAIGLNNQFSAGSFDLSFLLMYYGGYVTRVQAPDPTFVSSAGRTIEGALNYWKNAGDEQITDIPGFPTINTPGYFDAYAKTGYTYASKFVRKANHIRLRDIILTYNLKAPFVTRWGLNNMQIRAQVQNAYRFTFSGNDIDPDAIDRRNGTRSLTQKPFFSLSLYTNF